jgi:hypothetical protein
MTVTAALLAQRRSASIAGLVRGHRSRGVLEGVPDLKHALSFSCASLTWLLLIQSLAMAAEYRPLRESPSFEQDRAVELFDVQAPALAK